MNYEHKQIGRLHLYLITGGLAIGAAWCIAGPFFLPDKVWIIPALAFPIFMLTFGLSFRSLLIRDDGHCLTLRFGPLPFFQKRFPYSQMTSAEASRSSFIDGWGIHYILGRGWTYNLWGYDCVKIQMGKKIVRIGTDDVPGLLQLLQTKINAH